jgi:hypothetical protein
MNCEAVPPCVTVTGLIEIMFEEKSSLDISNENWLFACKLAIGETVNDIE